MSKKRHRTRSRLPDLATDPGQDSGGLSGAAFASPAPGPRASDTRASDTRASDAGSSPGASPSGPDPSGDAWPGAVPVQDAVVRRTADGWRVGDDELPDLTCAMVLADLLAAELPTEIQPAIPAAASPPPAVPQPDPAPAAARPADGSPADGSAADGRPARRRPASGRPAVEEEAHRLRTTVGQLEHALTARIRVEQAIGVLAERHRIRPRQAFEQLRTAARNRGRRVIDIAADVVASASNPLLQLPEELSRQRSSPRHTPRHSRRVLRSE
jgi:hypothetical protein